MQGGRNSHTWAVACAGAMAVSSAAAPCVAGGDEPRFTPGHVFVATAGICQPGHPPDRDRVFELDPQTGELTFFRSLPLNECAGIQGLVFTPDGSRLRAAFAWTSQVVEFDPQGNYEVVLDVTDGLAGPGANNSLAYDPQGNFYVANYTTGEILRFPVDGGPAEVLADLDDLPGDALIPSGLTLATDGDVYVSAWGIGTDYVFRIASSGKAGVFNSYGAPLGVASLTGDRCGGVYVSLEYPGDLLRYEAGNPDSPTVVLQEPVFFGGSVITVSPDQRSLYVVDDWSIYRVDIEQGALEVLADIPVMASSSGIAVAPYPRGDLDFNTTVDLGDLALFRVCLGGPGGTGVSCDCQVADVDMDRDVDLEDFATMQVGFTGE